MTSSFKIQERMKQKNIWAIGNGTNDPYHGQSDTYVNPSFGTHNCAPQYMAIPISSPNYPLGAQMCVRRPLCDDHFTPPNFVNGFHRFKPQLYDTEANYPIQKFNPDGYWDRRPRYEQDLLRDDYFRWETRFNSTGLETVRTPPDDPSNPNPYWYEYGYSFTPKEGLWDGRRVATNKEQSVPEYKYDLSRGVQPFSLWKGEQKQVRNPMVNTFDNRNYNRII